MLRNPLLNLWARLTCFACLAGMLAALIEILISVDGWLKFETGRELTTEIGARLVIALGLGIIVGTAAAVLALPYVLWRPAAMPERAENIIRNGSIVMVLFTGSSVLGVVLRWIMGVGLLDLTNHAYVVLWLCLSIVMFLAAFLWRIVAARPLVPSPELIEKLSGRAARRFLLIAGAAGLLAAFSDRLTARTPSRAARAAGIKPSGPNILLVTFDALSAEDMSLYGYHLPTTPNIDSLARSSVVFPNYYACSTFTTPSIISMLTGRYPSNTHVYQYGGRLRGAALGCTLPHVLRAGGYTTGASVANPGAHPDCLGFGADFDNLPPPPVKDLAMREAAMWFHSATLAADAGLGSRFVPYLMEHLSQRHFGQTHSFFPPIMSFQQAAKMLGELPSPFFLWVHAYAPHFPYLPEPPYLKSFLPDDELRTHSEFANMVDLKGWNYSSRRQPDIDKARLRYDEWIAEADGAFGQFMSILRSSGHFDETAVIVSADHGESFRGGYMGHGGPNQRRPVLHVPLVVHLPGQTERRDVSTVADQTRLAPTILEIAKIARPDWMDGESLCGLMRGEASSGTSLAFTQYFETSSAFKPVEQGTVGVIDGRHQYVYNLASKTGSLYDLKESDEQKIDLALTEPKLAATLQDNIVRRFPNLFRG